MNVFKSENDLRSWVRLAANGKSRWVEPAFGSTLGLPDVWVPTGEYGQVVNLELKIGKMEGALLRYKVRAEQKREMKAMRHDLCAVGLLVAISNTPDMVFMNIDDYSLSGAVCIEKMVDDGDGFLISSHRSIALTLGVNFIFSRGLKPNQNLSFGDGSPGS